MNDKAKKQLQEAVGHQIMKFRTQKKLTQEQLAEKAGISTSYVSMLERGTRLAPLYTLHDLAAALGVPPMLLVP